MATERTTNSNKRLQNVLQETAAELKGHPDVKSVKLRHLSDLTLSEDGRLTLAMELCPLYLPGPLEQSQLEHNPNGVASIIRSRVGRKWTTTTLALSSLNTHLQEIGISLRVRATFGDVGVLVASKDDIDPNLLNRHNNTYRNALGEFCDNAGIDLDYRKLSEVKTPKSPTQQVDQFIVVGGREVLDYTPSLDQLLEELGFASLILRTGVERKRAEVVPHAFQLSGGNVALWKGLVNTYIHYVGEAVTGSNMHLGMERASWLLAIQMFPRGYPLERMAALDIGVT